jgi:hypothetical protein
VSHRRAADPEVRGRILRCGRVGKLASSTQTCRTLLCTSVTHPGERRCRFSASARWRRTWPPRSSTASQPPPPLPLRRPPQVPASVWRQVAVATICSLATLGYGAWLLGLLAALGARLGELAAPTASDNQQPADSKKQPSQGESEVVRAKWWELYGHTALAHGAVPGASGGPPPTSLRGAVLRGVEDYRCTCFLTAAVAAVARCLTTRASASASSSPPWWLCMASSSPPAPERSNAREDPV